MRIKNPSTGIFIFLLSAIITLFPGFGIGQLTTMANSNSTSLVNSIIGPGVIVLWDSLSCPPTGTATFNGATSNLGLTDGIVLSSGDATDAAGPNSVVDITTDHMAIGDADLDMILAPNNSNDACALEFTFVATCPLFEITYVFASDEYNEFICQYNDAFGFFISGPGFAGPFANGAQNLAVVPGTTSPVSIASINNVGCGGPSNSIYYVNNDFQGAGTVEYDGFTTPLTASATVIPCDTYRVKMVIGDELDGSYDSAVFLEKVECTTPVYSLAVSTNPLGYPHSREGCIDGIFTIDKAANLGQATSLGITMSGTATSGMDYAPPPTSANFAVGQTSFDFTFSPFADLITEGVETITFIISDTVCNGIVAYDSISFTIEEELSLELGPDVEICVDSTLNIGVPPMPGATYSWDPITDLASPFASATDIIPTPPGLHQYILTEDFNGCIARDTIIIEVKPNPIANFSVSKVSICPEDTVITLFTGTAGVTSTYTWDFDGGQVLSGSGPGPYEVKFTSGGIKEISLKVIENGCESNVHKVSVSVFNNGAIVEDCSCFGTTDGFVNLNVMGGSPPYTYNWSTGQTIQDLSNLSSGNYIVTISDSDPNGCTVVDTFFINQPSNLTFNFQSSNLTCFGDDNGMTSVVPVGGNGNYSYLWAPGGETDSVLSNLSPGIYNVTLTDTAHTTGPPTSTVIYSEDFDPAGAWGLNIPTGANGPDNNYWVINDVEGGVIPPGCRIQNNGNNTLHIRAVSTFMTGAVYDAGGLCPFLGCPETNMRAESPIISTVGSSTLTLNFDFMGQGAGVDLASVWYDDGGGFTLLQSPLISPLCGAGNGQWDNFSMALPASCDNIPNLRIAFNWTNNDDGFGADPSIAVDNLEIVSATGGGGGFTLCTVEGSIEITEPQQLSVSIDNSTAVTCANLSNGTAQSSTTGGSGQIGFSWDATPVQTTQNATNLPGGLVTLTVTDDSMCTASANVNIFEPDPLVASLKNNQDISCFGADDAFVVIEYTGGVEPVSFLWSHDPLETADSAIGINAGSWSVILEDDNGCKDTVNFTVLEPSPLALSMDSTNINCYAYDDGTGLATISGGHGNYGYSWSPGGFTSSSIAGLSPGMYYVTVTDTFYSSSTTPVNQILYTETFDAPGNPWTLNIPTGVNGADNNYWINNDVEGGVTPPGCRIQNNGNNTLHIRAVSTFMTGAVYDAGGLCPFLSCPETNMRAESPIISTVGFTNLTLSFDFTGQGMGVDQASVWYDDGGGFQLLASPLVSPLCGAAGQWDVFSMTLPASCENIPNLRIAFNWTNNDDGMGADPSIAINDIQIEGLGNGVGSNNFLLCSITDSILIEEPEAFEISIDSITPLSCFGSNDGEAFASVLGAQGAYDIVWATLPNPQNGAAANNLPGGVIQVSVTDQTGCTATDDSIVFEPDSLQAWIANYNDVTCNGADNGFAVVQHTGGTPPFSYVWNGAPGYTTDSMDNIGPGNYVSIVTDSNNCIDTANVTIAEPDSLQIELNHTDVSCFGFTDGDISTIVNGGNGNYGYLWLPGGFTDPDINSLPAGTYILTLNDTAFTNGQVDLPATFELIYSEDFSLNQNWTLNVPNGVNGTDYNYWEISDVEGGVQVGDCQAQNNGNNTLFITSFLSPFDGANYDHGVNCGIQFCTQTNMVAESPIINTSNSTDLTLEFDFMAGGMISDEASFLYNDGSGWFPLAGVLSSGSCGDNGIWEHFSVQLPASCENNPDFQIGFQWTNDGDGVGSNPSVAIDNILLFGNVVQVQSDLSWGLCQMRDTVIITQPEDIIISLATENANCFGSADGSAWVTPTGGMPGYSYQWSSAPFAQSDTAINLAEGFYGVTVTDQLACKDSGQIYIGHPTPLVLTMTAIPPSCTGMDDGVASVDVDGGIEPYSYFWSTQPIQNTPSATGLGTGYYSVTVVDAHNCEATGTVQVPENPVLLVNMEIEDVLCFGTPTGQATANVLGGVEPYFFEWIPSGHTISNPIDLSAGDHLLITVDANGCIDSTEFQIDQPETVTLIPYSQPSTCALSNANGVAGVDVIGGSPPYSYHWNTVPPGQDPYMFDLPAGTYNVIVMDANQCTQSISVQVENIPGPTVSTFGLPSFCEGYDGDTLFSMGDGGTPPYSYEWFCNAVVCGLNDVHHQNPIALPSGTTTYYVEATDANGCVSSRDSLEIVMHLNPIVEAGSDQTLCGGQAPCIILTPTITSAPGPFIYEWYPKTGDYNDSIQNPCVRPDSTTIYTLVVESSNGCRSDYTTIDSASSITVEVNPIPIADAGPDQDVCFLDSVMLYGIGTGAGPDYEFEWSPSNGFTHDNISNPNVSPPSTTEYTLVVWSNNCPSYSDNVVVNVHTLPTAQIDMPEDMCLGDTVEMVANVGGDPTSDSYSYEWSPTDGIVEVFENGNALASPDTTTTYYLTATTSWGCNSILDSTILTTKISPQADAGPDFFTCYQGNLIQLKGGITYSNNHFPTDPSLLEIGWSPSNLLDDSTALKPWATAESSTTFYLTVRYGDCESIDSTNVSLFPDLGIGLEADTTSICSGDSTQLHAMGGIDNPSFSWSPALGQMDNQPSNPWVMPESTTTYTLILSEGECSDTTDLTINVIQTPRVDYISSNTEGCVDFTVDFLDISESNVIAWSWNFGDGTTSNLQHTQHTFTVPGEYTVYYEGSNFGHCSEVSDTILVTVHDSASADFSSSPEYPANLQLPNTTVHFSDDSENAEKWFWEFGDGNTSFEQNPVHSYLSSGVFYVSLRVWNTYGCEDVIQHGPFVVTSPDLFIPNVFSPNMDGTSDEFKVDYEGDQPFTLSLFDRWGGIMHYSMDKEKGWDGKNTSGVEMPAGVYYYVLTIGNKEYTGHITLLR